MKLSVIIPSHKAESTLPQTLESLNIAAAKWAAATGGDPKDVEIVVSWDKEGRGPSWARNRGLEKAKGDYVFFCDADDTVHEDFLLKPSAALERSAADLCFFTYAGGPELLSYEIDGNDKVRAAYLPAFFGYSNADVKRWNEGGDLYALKESGQVWRCAYRRKFLERHAVRFDELMTYFEDAAFLSNCVAFATKTVSLSDELYHYNPTPGGNLGTGWKSARHWDYKFKVLEFRKRLDAATGGELWRYCEASCALTALELMKERREDLPRYLADEKVRAAIRSFPMSLRHPMVLAAMSYLKWRAR